MFVHYFVNYFVRLQTHPLYTSHNITNIVHLWFCEKLDKKLAVSSSLKFRENIDHLARTAKREMRKWLMRWFTKCHLYTSHFANIFSHSRQFNDVCIAGLKVFGELASFTKGALATLRHFQNRVACLVLDNEVPVCRLKHPLPDDSCDYISC